MTQIGNKEIKHNVLFYVDCGMDFEEAYERGTHYHNATPNKYT